MLARRILSQSRVVRFKIPVLSCTPIIIQRRTVRFKASNVHHSEEKGDKDEREQKTDEKKEEPESEQEKPEVKIDPETAKKLRLFGLMTFVTSGILSFYLLKQMFATPMAGGGDPIPFNDFVEKFLKAGEIKYIIYSPSQGVAMAQLHEGAVIEGKPWPQPMVLVQYRDTNGENSKFEDEVRKVEEELGVRNQDRITITVVEGMSGRKVIEIVMALFILFFLFSQYGRLIRNRIVKTEAKGN